MKITSELKMHPLSPLNWFMDDIIIKSALQGDTMEEFRVGDEVEVIETMHNCPLRVGQRLVVRSIKGVYGGGNVKFEGYDDDYVFLGKYLKLIRRANMYKQGDVLVSPEGKDIKIHGAVGEVYITTRVKNGCSGIYSQKELDDYGYKLKPTEEQLVHLTIQDIADGKGVGVDPKLIRIKDA